MQERLRQLIEAKSEDAGESQTKHVLNEKDPIVEEFVNVWTEYRNTVSLNFFRAYSLFVSD